MRTIISDRNKKETSLKSELHSVQILLSSIIGHYKSKTKEATILKKDFKQKEDKFLEEFLDIRRLKEKVEDRLYKQDQSVQTINMLCKPKSFYDEKNKNTMAEQNVLAQAPTRTDEQIVPRSQWLQIGKSNLLFDAQKIQKNPRTSCLTPTSSERSLPLLVFQLSTFSSSGTL
ncbi:hypothetical protein Tco_0381623 [Tanacetum coccineum]